MGISEDLPPVPSEGKAPEKFSRYASQIPRLRGQKGWITSSDIGDLPPESQATYAGEDNTIHAGADAAPLGAIAAVTEAFDEPLTMEQVLAIADPFIT